MSPGYNWFSVFQLHPCGLLLLIWSNNIMWPSTIYSRRNNFRHSNINNWLSSIRPCILLYVKVYMRMWNYLDPKMCLSQAKSYPCLGGFWLIKLSFLPRYRFHKVCDKENIKPYHHGKLAGGIVNMMNRSHCAYCNYVVKLPFDYLFARNSLSNYSACHICSIICT